MNAKGAILNGAVGSEVFPEKKWDKNMILEKFLHQGYTIFGMLGLKIIV